MDLVFGKGEKALSYRDAYLRAKEELTDEQREAVRAEKARLKDAWFFKDLRYKNYKNHVAEQLGLKQHYF